MVPDEMSAAVNVDEPDDDEPKPVTRKSRRTSNVAAEPFSVAGTAGD
jgi:hypothetical protein